MPPLLLGTLLPLLWSRLFSPHVSALTPPLLLGYNKFPNTHFFRGKTRMVSWLDRVCYSCLLQSHAVFLLLSLVSTLIFSRSKDVLSHRNSSTHMSLGVHLRSWAPSSRSLCARLSSLQLTQPSVELFSL